MKRILFVLLFGLMLTSNVWAGDDFQYWSRYSLKVVDTDKIDWTIFTEARMYNDTNDLGLYYVSQKLSYAAWEHLSLGANYTYLNYRSQNSSGELADDRYQHRLEFEANPKFDLSDKLSLTNRNRVEFRWIENKGSYNTRVRHRWTLAYKITDHKPLSNVYCESEFFYNIAENDYDENRTIPLGLTFNLNSKTSLKTFYMIQTKLGSNDNWHANQIFGTQLSLKF